MTPKFTSPAKAVFFLLASAALAPEAQANLIVNGGFETAPDTAWSTFGLFASIMNSVSDAHSGSYYAGFGDFSSAGTFSQALATTIGTSYDLSFWLKDFAASGTRTFEVSVDNFASTLLSLTSGTNVYTQYNFSFTASSPSTTLIFRGRNDAASWLLDDVVVEASTGPAPTPEPATLALFALGAAGLRLSRKNRLS